MELAAAKMIGAGLAAIALAGVGIGMGTIFIIRICSYRSYRFICFSYCTFNTFCILIIKIKLLIF